MDEVILNGSQLIEPTTFTPTWLPELDIMSEPGDLNPTMPADEFSLESFFVDFAQMSANSQPHADGGGVTVTATWRGRGGIGGWDGGGQDTSYYVHEQHNGGTDAVPEITVVGRECNAEHTAAQNALQTLYENSPTARGLIDAAATRGTSISLIQANIAGFGSQNRFDPPTNTIFWDPFLGFSGTNNDATTYTQTPIIILAHELIHAAYPDDPRYRHGGSEDLVLPLANQIAREMNAVGYNFDTSRNTHSEGRRQFKVSSISSSVESIIRPGCG